MSFAMRRSVFRSKTSANVFRSSSPFAFVRHASILTSSWWSFRSSIIGAALHGPPLLKGVVPYAGEFAWTLRIASARGPRLRRLRGLLAEYVAMRAIRPEAGEAPAQRLTAPPSAGPPAPPRDASA